MEIAMRLLSGFRMKLFLFVVFLGILPLNSARPEQAMKKSSSLLHYKIDAQKSRFFVATGSAGVFSAFGHKHKISIPEFSGEVSFDPADLSKTSLHLSIVSNSLVVVADNQKEEKDKPKIEEAMREKVLEVSKFPDVDFRATGISASSIGQDEYDAEIHGDLTLHGVTRNITVKAKVDLGKDQLTAKGEFPLKQTDYQIQPVSVAGGTVKVKDEIRLSFEMLAHP
jgi:polyisoprenoid-binding protein YceI